MNAARIDVLAASLAGRCASGEERGAGRLTHAVPASQSRNLGSFVEVHGAALCGARPGRRSVGWSCWPAKEVTCRRCLARFGGGA